MEHFKPTKEDLPRVKSIVSDPNVIVWFKASPGLIEMLRRLDHPLAAKMPKSLRDILVRGQGVMMDKSMILKWFEGTLDQNNAFALENGELFVTFTSKEMQDGVLEQTADLRRDILKRS